MPTIESIVRQINKDLVPRFEEQLRTHLSNQDKDWLVDQIVRLTLDVHSLEDMDRRHIRLEESIRRAPRANRVKALRLNRAKLKKFLSLYKGLDRDHLIREGYLKRNSPPKGTDSISAQFRSAKGNDLLALSKDMLYGLLFGDESTKTSFSRIQRELLTLTVPRMKVEALDFMKATTELSAAGIWQDPKGAANDLRADNVILEIEFGEIEDELIGDGVIVALSLINNLEINEEILYGRMENVEQSTLIA